MQIVMLSETFTPSVNGVVNSVRHVAAQLCARGHDVTVVAPTGEDFDVPGGRVPVVRVPSVALPGYRSLRVMRPGTTLERVVHDLHPDVVHVASPAVLGQAGVRAARVLAVPCVTVFQTDLAAYVARRARTAPAPVRARVVERTWQWLAAVHRASDLTLAPSRPTLAELRRRGFGALALWPRGVDGKTFHPLRRDPVRHDALCNGRRLLVGVVGRLAPEKRLELLAPLDRHPDVRLVVIGDGPQRERLRSTLPHATFLGQRTGADLATTVASLDVLVHPGADETFAQAVQEALASGVPAVVAARGGPLDLVDHDGNGLLWTDDDPDTLATLVTGLGDDERRRRLAAAARPSVAHRTWSGVTDQLLGHYADVGAVATSWPVRAPRRAPEPAPRARSSHR